MVSREYIRVLPQLALYHILICDSSNCVTEKDVKIFEDQASFDNMPICHIIPDSKRLADADSSVQVSFVECRFWGLTNDCARFWVLLVLWMSVLSHTLTIHVRKRRKLSVMEERRLSWCILIPNTTCHTVKRHGEHIRSGRLPTSDRALVDISHDQRVELNVLTVEWLTDRTRYKGRGPLDSIYICLASDGSNLKMINHSASNASIQLNFWRLEDFRDCLYQPHDIDGSTSLADCFL